MARYTPKMLAALRHAYEETERPVRLIANDYKIGITTLQTLVEKHGWTKRSQRMRNEPPELRLLEEARRLETEMREAAAGSPDNPAPHEAAPGPALSGSGQTTGSETGAAGVPAASPSPSSVDLLEAKVRAAIQNVESAQKNGQRAGPENLARALSIHTETIQAIQRMRAGQFSNEAHRHDDYDMPADINAFRLALARRIEALAESDADEGDGDDSGDVAGAV